FAIAPGVLRMKDDLCAAHRRPSNRLGIAPAFMANRHSKLDAVYLEKLPRVSRHIELIFGRIELVLGLVSLNLAPSVNDDGCELAACIREPFYTEDGSHRISSSPLRNGPQCPLLLRLIPRQYFKILAAQTWQIGFGKTHNPRALRRSFRHQPPDLV